MKFILFLLEISLIKCVLIYYQNYEFLSTVKLLEYKQYYGNTRIFRYTIPNDVLLAIWRLQVFTHETCPSIAFYFYLDYAGYPVISTQNESFPHDYTRERLTRTFITNELVNGKKEFYINISSPLPGHWFSTAFIDNSNINKNNNIKPNFYTSSNCSTYFTASINLWRINDTQCITLNQTTYSQNHTQFKIYKFLSEPYYDGDLSINASYVYSNCTSVFLLRKSAFPNLADFNANDEFLNCSNKSFCKTQIQNYLPSTWYYIAIESTCNYTLLINNNREPHHVLPQTQQIPIETFRFIGPSNFLIKYYFNSYNPNNRSNTIYLNDTTHSTRYPPYFIEFQIDSQSNGGTLYLSLTNTLTKTNITHYNHNSTQIKLHVCVLFESMGYTRCPLGYKMIAQSEFDGYIPNLALNIAYPMIGKWFLAIWKECVSRDTNETLACPLDLVPYTYIQLTSDQCATNYCGDYGQCYTFNSQMNLLSACRCVAGYKGFGCTDASDATSRTTLLLSVLSLTLSNLIFLIPISLSLYRRFYTEALVYSYNMIFSTFYHACDQEYFSMCIFSYDSLQLADFISSYTSFTITILAMSSFSYKIKLFTFIVGILACLTVNLYDRFSTVAFVSILLVSFGVTLSTWIRICHRKRVLYPKKSTLIKFYLPGLLIASTGLVIFIFFQTKSNYFIMHSVWHACMALAIVFFLPKYRSFDSIQISSLSLSTIGSLEDNL